MILLGTVLMFLHFKITFVLLKFDYNFIIFYIYFFLLKFNLLDYKFKNFTIHKCPIAVRI